jgi:hypothetical protein
MQLAYGNQTGIVATVVRCIISSRNQATPSDETRLLAVNAMQQLVTTEQEKKKKTL